MAARPQLKNARQWVQAHESQLAEQVDACVKRLNEIIDASHTVPISVPASAIGSNDAVRKQVMDRLRQAEWRVKFTGGGEDDPVEITL